MAMATVLAAGVVATAAVHEAEDDNGRIERRWG